MYELLLLILILIVAILIYKCGNKVIQMVGGALDEIKESPHSKNAICTLVMYGDSYCAGAMVMAQSLKEFAPNYDSICMVTEDVTEAARADLAKVFTSVREVPYIKYNSRVITKRQEELYAAWMSGSYSKWNCLDFVEYDKILWLDADVIASESLEELMNMPVPAIVAGSPWSKPYDPKGINNPIGYKKHGEKITCDEITKMLRSFTSGLMGGVVYLKPKKGLTDKLRTMLARHEVFPPLHHKSMIFADEQAIVMNQCEDGQTWTNLATRFNYMVGKKSLLEGKKPVITHYYHQKPWEQARATWPELENWYKYADELVAQFPELAKWWPHRVKDSEESKAAFLKAESDAKAKLLKK